MSAKYNLQSWGGKKRAEGLSWCGLLKAVGVFARGREGGRRWNASNLRGASGAACAPVGEWVGGKLGL